MAAKNSAEGRRGFARIEIIGAGRSIADRRAYVDELSEVPAACALVKHGAGRFTEGNAELDSGHRLDQQFMNVIALDETNTVGKGETEAHKARLAEFVAKHAPHHGADLKVREVVVAGQPYNAIIDCAADEHADLVVMSSHGRSGLSRMLIGSVTDRLLRAAKCPVLVVPSHGKK